MGAEVNTLSKFYNLCSGSLNLSPFFDFCFWLHAIVLLVSVSRKNVIFHSRYQLQCSLLRISRRQLPLLQLLLLQ